MSERPTGKRTQILAETIFSDRCLLSLARFVEKLNKEHKEHKEHKADRTRGAAVR